MRQLVLWVSGYTHSRVRVRDEDIWEKASDTEKYDTHTPSTSNSVIIHLKIAHLTVRVF